MVALAKLIYTFYLCIYIFYPISIYPVIYSFTDDREITIHFLLQILLQSTQYKGWNNMWIESEGLPTSCFVFLLILLLLLFCFCVFVCFSQFFTTLLSHIAPWDGVMKPIYLVIFTFLRYLLPSGKKKIFLVFIHILYAIIKDRNLKLSYQRLNKIWDKRLTFQPVRT